MSMNNTTYRPSGWSPGTLFRLHFEWMALAAGLLLMAAMDPAAAGEGFCLLEWLGVHWCPGEGLGRSIAWVANGNIAKSMELNIMGIPTILILVGRISYLIDRNYHIANKIGSTLWPE